MKKKFTRDFSFTKSFRVYFDSNYGGAYDHIYPSSFIDLGPTKNQDTSMNWA